MKAPSLTTQRLRLRHWQDSDLDAFAAMNADPRVMEYFPATLSRAESDEQAAFIRKRLTETAFGLWAVERLEAEGFIGFVGLSVPRFEAHFTPCVEVGWRLAVAHWGQGFASEAARAALAYAFEGLGLDEAIAMAVPSNARSLRVMERVGMTRWEGGDFLHPGLPEGHRLRLHVLYRARPPSSPGRFS